ncbi:MAG: T9SS type A sorting domain-containing protein [Crocinitomicaceae bacterium]|nr:T9SS type A sorting domain-containing protein [Crocinitomicaceae bacterium]
MKKYYILALSTLMVGSISFAQQDRNPLIETFTSSTCPPCNPANIDLEALLAQPENDHKYVSVKYQVNWPGNGDPYFTDEVNTRRNFYSVNGVPDLFLDAGVGYSGNPSIMSQGDLDTRYATAPLVEIDAYYQVNETTQTVNVQVDYDVLADLPPSLRLFVVVFEYETLNNIGGNGETQFEHVMKKMMTGPTGLHQGSMTIGDSNYEEVSYTFEGSYILPPDAMTPADPAIEHTVEEFSDLGVAVWLQSSITKEVYQAVYAKAGFNPLSVEENEAFISAELYPNPTEGNAAIAFQMNDVQDVTIEVVNSLGQIVYSSELLNVEAGRTVHDFSTAEFASGLYSVTVRSKDGAISKKLSVQ